MVSRFNLPFIVSIVLVTIYKKNNIYNTVNLVTIGVCFECCSIGSPALIQLIDSNHEPSSDLAHEQVTGDSVNPTDGTVIPPMC